MGAEKPLLEKPGKQSQKTRVLWLVATGGLLMVIALFQIVNFPKKETSPALSAREEAKLQKRLREIDDSEQYVLLAEVDGWYPCLHSGRAIFFLRAGEVWKYGVTSKGKFGRYPAQFLFKNRVFYRVQFKGSHGDCLKQEQIKLYQYPYLPENLARPPQGRLPRPPYNRIMR